MTGVQTCALPIFYDARRPVYTHPRFLPGARLEDATVHHTVVAEGSRLERCAIDDSIVGIRATIKAGCSVRRSVLLGADYYEDDALAPTSSGPALGIGRNVVLDGVIVDKNARIGDNCRLTNEQKLETFDGDGFCIRDGIVVVPKDASVKAGTIV